MNRKPLIYTLLVTLLLTLLLPTASTLAQGGGTPITAANAAQVTQLARFGRGLITDVDWSPDGGTLLVAGSVGLWLYNANDVTAQPTLIAGHGGTVRSAAFSPDGRTIVSGSDDRTVQLWDAASGAQTASFESEQRLGTVWAVTFSPDGSLVAAGDDSRRIHIWDVASGSEVAVLEGHESTVVGLAFSPDSATLASASSDDTARLWDVASGAESAVIDGHTDDVRAVAFSPDGTTLATVSWDDTVRLWNVADGTETFSSDLHDDNVLDVAFSPDGTMLATSGTDDTVRLWNAALGGAAVATLEGHQGDVTDLAFSPDGAMLLSAGSDETVRLWNVASGAEMAQVPGHTDEALSAAFNPEGSLILAGYTDDLARLWSVSGGDADPIFTGEGHQNIDGNMTTTTFSPDGALFASADGFGVHVRNTQNQSDIAYLDDSETGLINSFAFSPDGALIAVTTWDGPVLLWDVGSGQLLASLSGHTEMANSVAFSQDGSLLVTSSDDGTVRLWGLAEPGAVALPTEEAAATEAVVATEEATAEATEEAAATAEPTEEVVAQPTSAFGALGGLGGGGAAPTMVPYTLGNLSFSRPEAWTAQETEAGAVLFLADPSDTTGQSAPLMAVSDHDLFNFGATLDEIETNVQAEITTVSRSERTTFAGYPALLISGTDLNNVYATLLAVAQPGGPYVILIVGGPAAQQNVIDAVFNAAMASLTIGPAQAGGAAGGAVAGGGGITYGQTVNGEITNASFEQDWTFSGSAGDVITITMIRTSDNLDTLIVLYDSAGTEIARNDDAATQVGDSPFNAQIPGFTLPTTGNYTILATRFGQQNGSTTGTYALTLEVAGGAGTGAAPGGVLVDAVRLTLDQSIIGSWNEIDAVELVGTTAEGTVLRQWATGATASSWYGGGDSWSPAQAAGAPDTPACGDQVTAWASATYTGPDSLTLTYATPVIPTEINIHQNYNPGAITQVEVLPIDPGVAPVVVFSGVDPTTACPGIFTIAVAEGGGTAGTTGGAAPGGGTLTYGQPVTGQITSASYEERWTFSGNAGDVITITMIRTSDNLDTLIVLYDSAGTEIARNDDAATQVGDSPFNAQIPGFTLPATGNYTILATRFGQQMGGSSGAYELTVELAAGGK